MHPPGKHIPLQLFPFPGLHRQKYISPFTAAFQVAAGFSPGAGAALHCSPPAPLSPLTAPVWGWILQPPGPTHLPDPSPKPKQNACSGQKQPGGDRAAPIQLCIDWLHYGRADCLSLIGVRRGARSARAEATGQEGRSVHGGCKQTGTQAGMRGIAPRPWPRPRGKGSHEKHRWHFQTHSTPCPAPRHLLQCMGGKEIFQGLQFITAPLLPSDVFLDSLPLKGSQWVPEFWGQHGAGRGEGAGFALHPPASGQGSA